MNSKDKRLLQRAPKQAQDILSLLPEGWKIDRHGPSTMGWYADLSYGNKKFRLVSDRSYIGVSSLKHGEMKTIESPQDQRINITPDQVSHLLIKGVREWGDNT